MLAVSSQYDYRQLNACGEDSFISANVEIRRPQLVSVGSHCAIDTGFYCTVSMEMGDYIHIAPYVTVIGGAQGRLTMGHFSSIAAGSRVICGSDDHMGAGLCGPTIPDQFKDHVTFAPVIFEPFANVTTNVVIMPGVTLAEGTVVGANSLVTKSTEPWTVYVGTPAKPIKSRPHVRMKDFARQLGYDV